jgi:hypothetical protein
MRGNGFNFCLSIRLQFFCRHFPKYFMGDFEIGRYLDRVRSAWDFFIRLSFCISGAFSKRSSPICGDYKEVLLNFLL